MKIRLSSYLTSLESHPRAYLVSGGQDPGPEVLGQALEIFPQANLIAADRGALYCLQAGYLPDLVLGDMDSLPPEARDRLAQAGVPGEVFPTDKDDTDTGLALDFLIRQGAQEIILLAGMGSRWDHSLTNVFLSAQAKARGVDLVFWDGDNRMRLVQEGAWEVEEAEGFHLSLVPLSSQGIDLSLEGFAYPLDHAHIPFGQSLLVSNIWVHNPGLVYLHKGQALLCIARDQERTSL